MSLVYTNQEFEETKIRYSIHPLLRNFTQRKLSQLHASVANGLIERFVGCFSNYAEKEIPSLIERKCIHGRQLEVGVEDISATMQWVEVELDNTRAAMDLCHERHYWNSLIRLVRAMSYFYATKGYWSERIRRGHQAAEAAAKLDNKKEEAWMYVNEVGYLLIQQGRWSEAEKVILKGQEILEREMRTLEDRGKIEEDARDQQGVQFISGLVKRYLGILLTKQSKYKAAEQAFEQAMEIFKRLDRESILANQKTEMGELALRQGDHQLARRYYQESLNYHDSQKDKKLWVYSWMARANNGLGDVAYQQGSYSEARTFYEEGLECALQTNSQDGIAYSKYRLALISEYEHQYGLALQLAEEAWDILLQIGRSEYVEDVKEMIERLRTLADQS
jgi:tetratricopeptide (TPR) repeat protein